MRRDLRKRLGKEWLFCDGGTGTILQAKGLRGGELPETWNLERPEEIIDLHSRYLEAGCDIFNTNTFGANALKFPERLQEIVTAAVELAKEARRRTGREDAYIALDIGPTGKLLQPLGDLPFERAVEIFGEVVRYGSAAGADLVMIETMSDSYEAKAAVLAAKENCDLPVCITTTYDGKGKLLTGGDVDSTVALLEGLHVDALGVNCGLGPEQMMPVVRRLTQVCSIPVIVNPNAGLPRTEGGKTVYNVGPEDFARQMEEIAAMGVHVVGGCCGTTPEHIRLTAQRVKKVPFQEPVPKHRTVVSSYSQCVEIGTRPVIIGERINPTGKKKFKQALRDNNIEYILEEGLRQEDSGAHILDVNVGLPEIDEPAMMGEVVTRLQSVLALPLQIDTSDPEALERGMRLYNGKPMVNSVNGKRESIETVFPLVRKYGGVLVALVLDEDGIPGDADGRIRIARKIYEAADRYGVPREDIVIDGLAMTISSDNTSALVTLETLRRVRAHDPGSVQYIVRPSQAGDHQLVFPCHGAPERTVCSDHESRKRRDDGGVQSLPCSREYGSAVHGLYSGVCRDTGQKTGGKRRCLIARRCSRRNTGCFGSRQSGPWRFGNGALRERGARHGRESGGSRTRGTKELRSAGSDQQGPDPRTGQGGQGFRERHGLSSAASDERGGRQGRF